MGKIGGYSYMNTNRDLSAYEQKQFTDILREIQKVETSKSQRKAQTIRGTHPSEQEVHGIKKITCVLGGTGGTQLMNTLAEYLETIGYSIQYIITSQVSYNVARTKTPIVTSLYEGVEKVLRFRSDVIFTETSCRNPLQMEILNMLKTRFHLYTVSFQDVWDDNDTRYNEFKPNLICSPTAYCHKALQKHGYLDNEIFPYTNPAFLTIPLIKKANIDRENPKVIYISQTRLYAKEMFRDIEILEQVYPNLDLTVQLHPNEEDYPDNKVKDKYPTVRNLLLPENYDLIVSVNSTVGLKTLLQGVPTIFSETDFYSNLMKFYNGLPVEVDDRYADFMECTDRNLFKSKTTSLMSLLDKQVASLKSTKSKLSRYMMS